MRELLKTNKYLLGIILLYICTHSTNLTLLSMFNDESIYLDWAWTASHMPGHLYDSLIDAKQPLMIWVFAVFQNFFPDPLFAGRFVSVLIGLTTLLGIYTLTQKLLNQRAANLAALLYTVVPLFVFYNRQALMEAAVASVGVWICVALINLLKEQTMRNSMLLGVLFGVGFFIKTSSLIFVLSASLVIGYFVFKKKKYELIKPYAIALGLFLIVDLLLLINPVFWQTLSSNSRYALTLSDLLMFPVSTWFNNLWGFLEIGFIFVTPLVFIAGITGTILLKRLKERSVGVFITYFLIALVIEIFTVKLQSQRYILPFLPFLVIPAAYLILKLGIGNTFKKSFTVALVALPIVASGLLLFKPDQYVLALANVSKYSELHYIQGQTSGHGVNEVMQYIKQNASTTKPNMVLFGFNIGNPESAVNLYSQRESNLVGLHIDSQMFEGLDAYQCFSSDYPVFFVTREDQLLGMERFFTEKRKYINPYTNYSIRIYTIKENCKGNTLSLSEIYQSPIIKSLELK